MSNSGLHSSVQHVGMPLPLKLFACFLSAFVICLALVFLAIGPVQLLTNFALHIFILPLSVLALLFFVDVLARRRFMPGKSRLALLLLLLAVAMQSGILLDWFAHWLMMPASIIAAIGIWRVYKLIGQGGVQQPSHPGLNWYRISLFFLGISLLALFLRPFFPAWQSALLHIHVQMSLYGFLGLAGISSLQVLLPAVSQRQDPSLPNRLKEDLPIVSFGVVLLSVGELLQPLISSLGLACLLLPLLRTALVWWRLYRDKICSLHGIAPVLAAALFGLVFSLLWALLGMVTLDLFIAGFLLPLLAGASSYLLPLWWLADVRPTAMKIGCLPMNHWSGLRAILYFLTGIMPVLSLTAAPYFGLLAFIWYVAIILRWSLNLSPGTSFFMIDPKRKNS